ncbi:MULTISPECIES: Smr/MutS family protein [Flavobacterium]|uniref:DNA mismatch repair protein MutS n=2 Tax=Flavobacterium TaxID=237 RepID=A0A437UA79_9FLAO|nr:MULTISPECIES: Smr/MutS family protein [Flavobacterium]OWP83279.1 DNA mismatch repair protein MutS [Flavobacterium davisii]QYS89299.1 Smr/MutS family protein [Flavobacterium davisii]RVU90501.1 DNA mismatch repair protein MutS [Flavobacterium columnare]SPE78195.1 recombination and DNA strand exchange inhibitor protein [Flavobacterium columnare]
MFFIGDSVSVLDDNINGVVIKVTGDQVWIETEEGFELPFKNNELILIDQTGLDFSKANFYAIKKEKEISKPKNFIKERKSKKDETVLEVDLHIEKLVQTTKGMNNYDILNIQVETAQRQLDFAIKNRIQKVVLIHGVGEGILKAELDFLLSRYSYISFQEASFQKYGFGATEVYINQKNFL